MPHEGTHVQFPDLIDNLDRWAEFDPSSPVGSVLRSRLRKDVMVTSKRKVIDSALEADLAAFASAVYQGGYDAGYAKGVDNGKDSVVAAEPFKAWEVWETTDEYGRHGAMIGLFTDEADANRFAEGKGWYGGNGAVVGGQAVTIGDTIYIIRSMINKEDLNISLPEKAKIRRQAALDKLTDEDKRILGIKE